MLQRVVRTCLKKTWLFFIILSVLILSLFTTYHVFTSTAANRKALAENFLGKKLHHRVHLEKLTIKWSGLEPMLVVENASIQESVRIKQLAFKVDLWHSLLHLKVLPDSLKVEGAEIKLVQQENKTWRISGLGATNSAPQKDSGDLKQLFYWLALQANVSVSQVDVQLSFFHGRRVILTDVGLGMRDDSRHREVAITGKIKTNQLPYPFHLVIKPDRHNSTSDKLTAHFYLQLPHLGLPANLMQDVFFDKKFPLGISIGDAGVDLWGELHAGQFTQVRAKVLGKEIAFENSKSRFKYIVEKFSTNALWEEKKLGWQLSLDKLNLESATGLARTHVLTLGFSKSDLGIKYSLSADAMSLNDLRQYSRISTYWDENLEKWDQALEVGGDLSHLAFWYQKNIKRKAHYNLASDFVNFTMNAYKQVPGVRNLKGKVKLNQNSGELLIASNKVEINYADVFLHPLDFDLLEMQFHWDFLESGGKLWHVQHIHLKNNYLDFAGDIQLTQPSSGHKRFNLQGEFSTQDVGLLSHYTPKKFLPGLLEGWLRQAFQRGEVKKGVVSINGPLGEASHPLQVNAKIEVSKLGVRYAPKWPAISDLEGTILFVNKKMQIKANHAKIKGVEINGISAEIADMSAPVLTVAVDSPIDLQGGISFLQYTPLDVGKAIADWKGQGKVQFKLKLVDDFSAKVNKVDVLGSIHFNKNQVSLLPLSVPLTEVVGVFDFKNEVLDSPTISAKFLGQPLSASIATVPTVDGSSQLKVAFQGGFDFSQLSGEKFPFLKDKVEGSAKYKGQINIRELGDKFSGGIAVYSDLQGVKIQLPEPFYKPLDKAQKFLFNLNFGGKEGVVANLEMDKLLACRAQFNFDEKGLGLLSGSFHLGAGSAIWPKAPGLYIDGFLPAFNWNEWLPYIKPYLSESKPDLTLLNLLKDAQLEVRQANIAGHEFGNTFINFSQQGDGFNLGVENRQITGVLKIPKKISQRWLINLKKLDFKFNKGSYKQVEAWQTHLDPRDLPSLVLNCKQCKINHKSLGKVKFEMVKVKNGIKFSRFDVENSNYSIQAKGSWTLHSNGFITDLYGDFTNYNLGRFLSDWGYSSVVSHGFGETMFSLSWLGSPYKMNRSSLTGHIAFRYSDGRITKLSHRTESKIGLGRLLNILSLQSLPQNVLTGFANLGKKGFEFDSFKGDLSIINGVGYTKNVELEGPVAWVNVNGSVDLSEKRYDFMMQVTPNVTSSLPLIVGIAGGPVAGALTWMANNLLASKIGLMVKKSYHMKGSMQ